MEKLVAVVKYNVDKSNKGLNSWSIDRVIDVITLEESESMIRVVRRNGGFNTFKIN